MFGKHDHIAQLFVDLVRMLVSSEVTLHPLGRQRFKGSRYIATASSDLQSIFIDIGSKYLHYSAELAMPPLGLGNH